MPQLIRDRALATSDWVLAGDAATGGGRLMLPLVEYLKAMAAGAPAQDRAVLLQPEQQDLAALAPYVPALPLIAVHFPASGDGRGFTQASLLRERHGYLGELRAVGMIRVDQMWFLARCGFDAFELLDGEDPLLAIAQLERFSVAYQAGVDELTHPRRRHGG